MNEIRACKILNIKSIKNINLDNIKKIYKRKALLYHPDKNKDNNCNNFIELTEAYNFILDNHSNSSQRNELMKEFIFSFLDNYTILNESKTKEKIYVNIIKNLENIGENAFIKIIEKLNNDQILKLDDFIKNNNVLNIPIAIVNILTKKANDVRSNIEYIILKPNLNDLFENNVFKLKKNDKNFIIPLWHHELIYDYNNSEICIKNIPNLPNNIHIDEFNNIFVYLEYNITDIWDCDNIRFDINNKEYIIQRKKLKMEKNQKFIFKKKGIAKINNHNIFDISKKSDIIVNIQLSL